MSNIIKKLHDRKNRMAFGDIFIDKFRLKRGVADEERFWRNGAFLRRSQHI